MRICICDDESYICERIKQLCQDYFHGIDNEYEVFCTDNGYEVERQADNIDLIILDIEMPLMNGVRLKNLLQGRKQNAYIIFVTRHENLMEAAFGANVIGFINKNSLEEKIFKYLELSVNLIEKNMIIDNKYHSRQVLFISSEKEYCKLHFISGKTVLIRISLNRISRDLESVDFIKISRFYVVNMKYITGYENNFLYVGDEKFKISRRNSSLIRKIYEEYCERNAKFC